MGWPVVVVDSGGIAITESTNGLGTPVTIAANGLGVAVTPVWQGGIPILGGGEVVPIFHADTMHITADSTVITADYSR